VADCVQEMLGRFAFPAGEKTAEAYGNGHINDTYRVRVEGVREQFVLQRINDYVFIHPREVMENIRRVTEFLDEKILQEGGDPRRETLRLLPALDGDCCAADPEGHIWRTFLFIPDTFSTDLPSLPVLEECGRAFGVFSRRLSDFPAETLHESIRAFHDTPNRFRQLTEAAERDAHGRLREVEAEMVFAREREQGTRALTDALAAGKLPLRVTHNDTKVNNVLLDRGTEKAVCVVDLDTVMPGLLAYDFGDAIRVGACTAAEDERDLSLVSLDLEKYRAFARGFLGELKQGLGREEILSLATGAWMMTLENGLRFLADHLNGDVYFKIHRPGQNLDRARTQFALVRDMERKMEEMEKILLEV